MARAEKKDTFNPQEMKKKDLLAELRNRLNVVSEDWQTPTICLVLAADLFDVDYGFVVHGVKVKRPTLIEEGQSWIYGRKSPEDKATKNLAAFYFEHRVELHNFVNLLDHELTNRLKAADPKRKEIELSIYRDEYEDCYGMEICVTGTPTVRVLQLMESSLADDYLYTRVALPLIIEVAKRHHTTLYYTSIVSGDRGNDEHATNPFTEQRFLFRQ